MNKLSLATLAVLSVLLIGDAGCSDSGSEPVEVNDDSGVSDAARDGTSMPPADASNSASDAAKEAGADAAHEAGVVCAEPSDCPTPAGGCADRTCTNGTCSTTPRAAGASSSEEVAGDCKKKQCDGAGALVIVNDDNDVPVDGNDCTGDRCLNGAPSNPPVSAGKVCGTGGTLKCDGGGVCVGCLAPTDCAGQDTACQSRTCAAHVCGVANQPIGTAIPTQTAGDCKVVQCNGSGASQIASDNSDVPVDSETCTKDLCTSGVASNPPEPATVACHEGNGITCSGTGACVACNVASDCPGQDTACRLRACNAGACGAVLVALGTKVGVQVSGDCKDAVCDGAGNVTTQNDDSDVKDDQNICTDDGCTSGAPTHLSKGDGFVCGTNLECHGGVCTGCGTASDCPGTDDECKTRTCTSGVCGFNVSASGALLSAQTSGDCKNQVCDGVGGVKGAVNDADLPIDDGNQCTGEVCTNGTPSHPARPVDTACNQNGGAFCGASATCVACNAAVECPGQDDACQTRTCTNGACGIAFQSAGAPVGTQTAGDCSVKQCDGAGGIVAVEANGDVPADDGNACTGEVCNGGVPSHPARPINTACGANGASFCSAGATCVQCNVPTQCAGNDTACQARTCTANACGVSFMPAGTATSTQVTGDCRQNQCDGAGNTVNVVSNGDVPADDGNQCTAEICTSGVAGHPSQPVNTACNQGGGSLCNSVATCVQCNAATQCAGSDTECRARTCTANACGVNNAAAGTATSAQTAGDCRQNQCDGAGNIVSAASNGDVPADDGNQCTSETCTSGVTGHPSQPIDTACNQGGGSFCSSVATCVQCNFATECPGIDTECRSRTCAGNTCGVSNAPAGTPTAAQTSGDCQQNQCDGVGNIVSVTSNSDVPADDGNQCTAEVCASGAGSHPNVPFDTACNQGGGTLCDGGGSCISRPEVAATFPADASTPAASSIVSVTFTTAMNPATLNGQTTAGACSGSIQVSPNDFASCIAFASTAAVMSSGNAVATLTAAPGLLVNTLYKIRVTTAAASATSVPLSAQFTQPAGFTTTSPNLCNGSLVISQVYGGGGAVGAAYKNDFVELHNLGATAVSLSGKSLQYSSATGTSWSVALLSGTLQPGAFALVQLASAGAAGSSLPTPDLIPANQINMAAASGKVALINGTTASPNGLCPPAATTIDMVGYGAATASCVNGAPTAVLSATSAAVRVQNACANTGSNSADFVVAAVAPRNSATSIAVCGCYALNESNSALEADYCDVQFPLSLNVQTGTTTPIVYGQIYEQATTEAAGASASVRAQLGYGPVTSNPEYEAGWTWTNATYNVQSGNNDEYQASFTAPAVGSYRYVYRMSVDQGVSWTLCDMNAGDGGSGSNANLTFDFQNEPVLNVTP